MADIPLKDYAVVLGRALLDAELYRIKPEGNLTVSDEGGYSVEFGRINGQNVGLQVWIDMAARDDRMNPPNTIHPRHFSGSLCTVSSRVKFNLSVRPGNFVWPR